MVWEIVITFGVLLLVSLLWYYWVGKVLQSKNKQNLGKKEPPQAHAKLMAEALKSIVDTSVANQYPIDRAVRIDHKRSIYICEPFHLDVLIGKEGTTPGFPPSKPDVISTSSEKLQFNAFEEDPLIQVELKFAEGDFSANTTQEQQKLKKNEVTKFRFLLKPLNAEDCILTVVISYVSEVPVPEQITEKVIIDKTISPEEGLVTREYSKQETVTPASTAPEVVEVKTVELLVSTKSLFGRNTRELELMRTVLGPVITLILLIIALYTGRVEGSDALWYGILGLVNVGGIPVIDAIQNLSSQQSEESE